MSYTGAWCEKGARRVPSLQNCLCKSRLCLRSFGVPAAGLLRRIHVVPALVSEHPLLCSQSQSVAGPFRVQQSGQQQQQQRQQQQQPQQQQQQQQPPELCIAEQADVYAPARGLPADSAPLSRPLEVVSRCLPGALAGLGSTNDLFWSLFGQQDAHDTFWLDRYAASPPRAPSTYECCTWRPDADTA